VRLGPQSQDVLYLDLTVLPKGTFERAIQRAQGWMRKTPPNQILTVDIAAARMLNIYPMPAQPVTPGATVAGNIKRNTD
jgi:hypothetical protein